MKNLEEVEAELERIRKKTEMEAEIFYQKHNILPMQKDNICVLPTQKEEVLYTLYSNKTSNLY